MHNATKLRQELDDLRAQLTATAAENYRLRVTASEDVAVARYAIHAVWVKYDLTQQQARQVMVHIANNGDDFADIDAEVRKAIVELGLA